MILPAIILRRSLWAPGPRFVQVSSSLCFFLVVFGHWDSGLAAFDPAVVMGRPHGRVFLGMGSSILPFLGSQLGGCLPRSGIFRVCVLEVAAPIG
jgi:hypothetical protein